jgi:hypothetical protein
MNSSFIGATTIASATAIAGIVSTFAVYGSAKESPLKNIADSIFSDEFLIENLKTIEYYKELCYALKSNIIIFRIGQIITPDKYQNFKYYYIIDILEHLSSELKYKEINQFTSIELIQQYIISKLGNSIKTNIVLAPFLKCDSDIHKELRYISKDIQTLFGEIIRLLQYAPLFYKNNDSSFMCLHNDIVKSGETNLFTKLNIRPNMFFDLGSEDANIQKILEYYHNSVGVSNTFREKIAKGIKKILKEKDLQLEILKSENEKLKEDLQNVKSYEEELKALNEYASAYKELKSLNTFYIVENEELKDEIKKLKEYIRNTGI